MRNKAVIARIEHRRMQEAVDEHGARRFVEFVFDRDAPDRKFYDGVQVERRVATDGYLENLHAIHLAHRPNEGEAAKDSKHRRRSEEHTSELQSLMRIQYAA